MLGITKNTPRLSNSNHPTDGYLRRNAENLISQLVAPSFLQLSTLFFQKNNIEEKELHTFFQEITFNQQEWMPFLRIYTSFLQYQSSFFQEKNRRKKNAFHTSNPQLFLRRKKVKMGSFILIQLVIIQKYFINFFLPCQ